MRRVNAVFAIEFAFSAGQSKEKLPKTEEEKELWSTLDATVLQWIYAIISHDHLHTILEPDTIAMEAWNRLCDIFQDNKHSHAVTLEYNFTHVNMEDFPNVSTYCQHLKSLLDQLKNVGSPVDNNRLAGFANKAAHSSSSFMVSRDSNGSHDISDHSSSNCKTNSGKRNQNCKNNGEKNHSNNGGRGGNKGGTGGGGKAGGGGQMGGSNSHGGGQQPTG
ncbi:hypothetical protein H5410_041417 [Solanum commersonii]|uniref:Uncharacterized protein n=1 Tax=Solanum commersonii TaxID=4109 RepID=A0A9J5XTJ4_SOLCO|nr:hypothetical protein H5410_041417 [Solanum commersonii]